jgi:hypothetical protein
MGQGPPVVERGKIERMTPADGATVLTEAHGVDGSPPALDAEGALAVADAGITDENLLVIAAGHDHPAAIGMKTRSGH